MSNKHTEYPVVYMWHIILRIKSHDSNNFRHIQCRKEKLSLIFIFCTRNATSQQCLNSHFFTSFKELRCFCLQFFRRVVIVLRLLIVISAFPHRFYAKNLFVFHVLKGIARRSFCYKIVLIVQCCLPSQNVCLRL